MRRTLTAATTALVAVALLAGCSGGSSDEGGTAETSAPSKTSAPSETSAAAQTKTEACALVERELKSFIDEQTSSSAPADPAARAAIVGAFADRLDAALPKVTNDSVHDAFEDFTDDARDYASAITDSGSTDSTEATAAQGDVQSSLNEVSAVCPGS